jgi:hypothetical protein
MRINAYFTNLIHNTFYKYSCITKCCKHSEETSIDREDKNINQRYVALLDKEYSTLISNKSRDKEKFTNRTVDELELLLENGFKNTNINSFQNKQRHSKFGISDGTMYMKNFFIPFSEAIYKIMKKTTISFNDKKTIIMHAIRRIQNSEYVFTEDQIHFASEVLVAALNYMQLNLYTNLSIHTNNLSNKTEDRLDIHNLFIDGNILYKDFNSYNLNLNNKGPFVFDYNYRSIERCVRAFSYMLHNRINKQNTRVTFRELQDVNSILGGKKISKNKTQFIKVSNEFKTQILYMLTIGYISYLVYDDGHWVQYNKQQLESLISNSLQDDICLDEFDSITESYRISKLHLDANNIAAAKKYLENLDIMCNTGNLHKSLSGIDKTCMLKHNFYLTSDALYINTSYIYDKPKIDVVKSLLASYYKVLDTTSSKINIIKIAVWLCCTLESIHPFDDANNKTLFYTLLPILLYENNMWLTRALYNSWQQLSLFSSEDKYKYILQLCTNLPQIDADFTWDANISLNEKFRISCAIGDVNALNDILKKNPHMIGISVIVSPNKPHINPVEFALLYGQKDVVQLLLSYEAWQPTKNNLIKMHQIYKNKDLCYYNQETNDFLESYIQQLADENTTTQF